MAQDNAGTVRAIEEAWDRGELDQLDEHFAANFDNSRSGTPGLPGGLKGAKMAHQGSCSPSPTARWRSWT
jgi:ketosteroid isomerase-like protein